MEDREDEIIIEQTEINTKRKEDEAPFLNKLFTQYLSLAFSVIAIFMIFLARFISLCGGFGASQWFNFFAFVFIALALLIELVKIVRDGKVDFKSTILPVFGVALIFF